MLIPRGRELRKLRRVAAVVAVVAVLTLGSRPAAGQEPGQWTQFVVTSGTASFDAATNVSAITVHGKSTALSGRVWLRRDAHGFLLRGLEVTVPVDSLTTGMVLRDKHMRSNVFTTDGGEMPDLRFAVGKAACSAGKAKKNQTCVFAGELTIRDTSRPFSVTAKLSQEKGVVKAVADGMVRLSAYGIERPSQLGVVAEDVVQLHFVLVSTPSVRERTAVRSVATR